MRSQKSRRFEEPLITEFMYSALNSQGALIRGASISHEFPRHVHETYTIGIVETGARVIRRGTAETIVNAGSGFIIEPGIPHGCATFGTTEHTYTALSIERNLMEALALQGDGYAGWAPRFRVTWFCDSDLFEGIKKLHGMRTGDASTGRFTDGLLSILRTLIHRYESVPTGETRGDPANAHIRELLEYLEANTQVNLSQKEIAEVAGLSEFHLNRTFRRVMGAPPHAYHLKIRIRKARELLGEGASIVTAALETGFYDQSHFTHCFKKTVGVTPGRYRLYKLG